MAFHLPSVASTSSMSDSSLDAPTRVAPREGAVGSLVGGKYRIDRVIGRGGMGVVLAAQHLHLEQVVAVKLMSEAAARDPEATARFLREGKLASRLRSEHVARVLDVGTLASGEPFLVMEMLDGKDLGVILDEEGPLPTAVAIDYLLQALEAIAEAHALGIVHRDLKPSNLVRTSRPDGSPCIKVLDFGLSKSLDPQAASAALTQSVAGALGSPLYMAPEQVRSSRSVGPASDQWSSAVTLFELLTRGAPFGGDSVGAILAAIIADRPRTLRSRGKIVPAGLEAAIARALAKEPGDRHRDVGAWAAALAPYGTRSARESAWRIAATLAGGSIAEGPPASAVGGGLGHTARWLRRHALAMGALSAACCAAAVAVGLHGAGDPDAIVATAVAPTDTLPRHEPTSPPKPAETALAQDAAVVAKPADTSADAAAEAPPDERPTVPRHEAQPGAARTAAPRPPTSQPAKPAPSSPARSVEDLLDKGRR